MVKKVGVLNYFFEYVIIQMVIELYSSRPAGLCLFIIFADAQWKNDHFFGSLRFRENHTRAAYC
jgi:hypothetical protein